MAVYNLTNLTNANNLLEYTQVINTFSEGFFGLGLFASMLFIIFGIARTSAPQVESAKIILGTLWFGALFSILFFRMEFLSEVHVLAIFVLSSGFTLLLWFQAKREG